MKKFPTPQELQEQRDREFDEKFKDAHRKVYGPPQDEFVPDEKNWKGTAEELQAWIDSGERSFYEIGEQTKLLSQKWQVADEEERKRLDEMGNILYRASRKLILEDQKNGGFSATDAYKEAFGDDKPKA